MEMNIKTILYTLVVGLISYFLRDLYGYVKRQVIKGDKPKLSLNHSYRHKMTHGTNPRLYRFKSSLIIKNIDTIPLYDVQIQQIINGQTKTISQQESLNVQEVIKINNEFEIPYGQNGNLIKEAEEQLPESFRKPEITVSFSNKNGHKFKKQLI